MKLISAALKINTSDRTLRKYEKGEIKNKDPAVFLKAMEIYGDENIGLAYLNEDPVFKRLFGGGVESLLEKIMRKIINNMHTAIDMFYGANNRIGFAY